jgi:ABC-type uncharacterized transport system permease subunit
MLKALEAYTVIVICGYPILELAVLGCIYLSPQHTLKMSRFWKSRASTLRERGVGFMKMRSSVVSPIAELRAKEDLLSKTSESV